MISGMVAWGNGEPCPFCGRGDIPDEEHADHLKDEHGPKLLSELFPDDE